MGKMFCLYLVLLLFMITLALYAWLSEMNTKIVNLWRVINLGLFGLFYCATLFHFCNYGHHLANIVRYQKVLFEHVFGVFRLCYRLEYNKLTKYRHKIFPPGTKYECSIPANWRSP
jgi:phosphoglycerol transferase MdoB-like AlkP superfamily enzyme